MSVVMSKLKKVGFVKIKPLDWTIVTSTCVLICKIVYDLHYSWKIYSLLTVHCPSDIRFIQELWNQ